MNVLKKVFVTAAAASSVALLAAQPAFGRDGNPSARSLSEVSTIRVEGNLCPSRVSNQLNDHGFLASSNSGPTDAVLELNVSTDGSLADQDTMEEGRYTATLVGANGEVLFEQSGNRESSNLGYLCEKIGRDIANGLQDEIS